MEYSANPLADLNMESIIRPIKPLRELNPAEWTHERLGSYIKDFESELDDEHEIGARLVSFGSTVVFHITEFGFWGPDIISFSGFSDNGERVQLIQNVSQLSILLIAMKKLGDKPRRIGFKTDESEISNS